MSGAAHSLKSAVVLGHGTIATAICDWFASSRRYDLISVVPVVPDPSGQHMLERWAQHNSVTYVPSGNYEDLQNVSRDAWFIDLSFSAGYDRIIQKWFLDKCGLALNLHNSVLPAYRGVAPINWALKNEEHMHGATIHVMTPEIDAGPIVAQVAYSIYPEFDEVIDVYERSTAYKMALFTETMKIIDRIEPIPQDESRAAYFSKADLGRLGVRAGLMRSEELG